ncbi:MAG TPA: DNA recombination protein RmuC, partial [Anaerolineae bacterium]|nr:DNA recombination protein RmuC [Anaerolineae bacterium]
MSQARLSYLTERMPDVGAIDSLSRRLQEVDDSSRKSFERLAGNLGELGKATEQMMEVGKTISSLENLLRPPKLRGGMGELLLGELLSQVLPGNYELQHHFKSGATVDAVIHLGDAMVPVDSKFPLEAFRRLGEAEDEAAAKQERKGFIKSVKARIDEIATKYILPDEGTYDFALMYIPAENVYYEAILKDEESAGLLPYALEKRVIPVSPNSFYAYLQVIIRGLKGMRIEERAGQILDYLSRLQGDEERFRSDFDTLGGHIENARKKYEEAERRLNRFEDKLLAPGESVELGGLPPPDVPG